METVFWFCFVYVLNFLRFEFPFDRSCGIDTLCVKIMLLYIF